MSHNQIKVKPFEVLVLMAVYMRDQSLSISMFESTDEALVEVFDDLLLVFSYKLFNHGMV